LGIKDPLPYIAIGKTYSQLGEFYMASLNMKKAVSYDIANPEVYGSLGVVYHKARNFESAIPALKCAVYGCGAEESCEARQCDAETEPQVEIEGLPLNINTVIYYYVYGSDLAGMHRPNNDYCGEAMKVLGEVRAEFADDETIMSIVEASESICESFGYNRVN
jgi:hypothetical protein